MSETDNIKQPEALPPGSSSAAFFYDPDFRSRVHPKDSKKPFCCRCQKNVDVSKAVAVTINEETWMAVIGHGRAEEIRTNFNPGRSDLCGDGWIGKDCLTKLRKLNANCPSVGATDKDNERETGK